MTTSVHVWYTNPRFHICTLLVHPPPRLWANQQMAEIDLEMALISMTSHGEMNNLYSLIRLVPLVSQAVAKAGEAWMCEMLLLSPPALCALGSSSDAAYFHYGLLWTLI